MITAQLDLDRLAGRAVEGQLGLDRAGRDVTAQQDLKRDEFVARRLKRDLAARGIPQMIGSQVAVGLAGDQLAGDRIDLVQLVEDRDLDAGDLGQ